VLVPGGRQVDIYLYSADMRYRYAFARWWDAAGSLDLWILLNPGKGDTETRRRPTLERCLRWSKSSGAGGLMFANLFAARHNKPSGLCKTKDPVGPHNDAVLAVMSGIADRTFVAWGKIGHLHNRAAAVISILNRPFCLGVTASGQPRHPLYVAADVSVEPWPVKWAAVDPI
jgi:hypothetical protein